ncbi:hypothetical protein CDAR_211491 [Caerostris darwini]|uniref:Uncharacterized protein n=1 Tax=Caerostris darwini TaxID=1538125 RepID=A0AAV4P635_9ARAC|nr:hypothetical protein CDAR_211491 [Caerostris darwini]
MFNFLSLGGIPSSGFDFWATPDYHQCFHQTSALTHRPLFLCLPFKKGFHCNHQKRCSTSCRMVVFHLQILTSGQHPTTNCAFTKPLLLLIHCLPFKKGGPEL